MPPGTKQITQVSEARKAVLSREKTAQGGGLQKGEHGAYGA